MHSGDPTTHFSTIRISLAKHPTIVTTSVDDDLLADPKAAIQDAR
jgi:hypothetical protein